MSHLKIDCDHISEISVYSPHTERSGEWTREVNYRIVSLFFNKKSSVYTLNDNDKNIIIEGRWEVDSHIQRLNWVIKNWKYCPKCGKKLEPKVISRD